METIGSEVGLKMRSAIKAKLMELGCYVDDELPDYVMVMVANKRTRSQMEEDLQLFLSANTEAFVSWLHQVLQKLQEVTINTSIVQNAETKKLKSKQSSSKKKDKNKSKQKEKLKKAKKEKRSKSLDRNKDAERLTPNIPPLFMNLEKESSPSITDVFAGQILKSHGIMPKSASFNNSLNLELPVIKSDNSPIRKPRLPIIDPATVSLVISDNDHPKTTNLINLPSISDNHKLKLQPDLDLKKKPDDSNVINLHYDETEDLIDFEDDSLPVSKESKPSNSTNSATRKLIEAPSPMRSRVEREPIKAPQTDFPQIELNLPKRPIRDRLGIREKAVNLVNPYQNNKSSEHSSKEDSNYNNEIKHTDKLSSKSYLGMNSNHSSIKSRLTTKKDNSRNRKLNKEESKHKKKIGSRIVPVPTMESNKNLTVASVVRAPPRPLPQGITASTNLLFRAMADAHKSLLTMPPKMDTVLSKKKKAFVLPMRRIKPQKIIIEVPTNKFEEKNDSNSDFEIEMDVESLDEYECERDIPSTEYVPVSLGSKPEITKVVDYVPTHISKKNDVNKSDTIKRNDNPQFVVTLEGVNTNLFLEKKLEMISRESNDNEVEDVKSKEEERKQSPKVKEKVHKKKSPRINSSEKIKEDAINQITKESSITPVKAEPPEIVDAIKSEDKAASPQRKRKGSPIVFSKDDVKPSKITVIKNDGGVKSRQTVANKYDSVPSLLLDRQQRSVRERCRFYPDCKLGNSCEFYHPPTIKMASICKTFPTCIYGDKCLYTHPPCKFDMACVRKDCPYSHKEKPKAAPPALVLASHVVPSLNYKAVTPTSMAPCKYYPNCNKYDCKWYHPIACKFGVKCINKMECNFYHSNLASFKWKSPQI